MTEGTDRDEFDDRNHRGGEGGQEGKGGEGGQDGEGSQDGEIGEDDEGGEIGADRAATTPSPDDGERPSAAERRLPPAIRAGDSPLPTAVLAEALRLTRHARAATTDAERAAVRERREELLAEHGYAARVRAADETLVCHPAEWVDGGTADLDAIEDTGRAVEISLEGASEGEPFDDVAAHNDAVAERVAADHGPVHGETAAAFATYMSNHHAAPIDRATARQVATFREEYFPRNAWPSAAQRERVAETLRLVFEAAGVEPPAGALE